MGKQNEGLAKKAETEAKQAKSSIHRPRRPVKQTDWDAKSDTSEATISTVASESFCSEEVRSQAAAQAAKNKEVLKLEKKLHEIAKLESSPNLDFLQKKKVEQKAELETQLETVWGLAMARARNELKQQGA